MGCWNDFAKIQWTGLNMGRKFPKNTYLASFLTINISQLNHCSPIFNKGLYILYVFNKVLYIQIDI